MSDQSVQSGAASGAYGTTAGINVKRWPGEIPLFIIGIIFSLIIWAALALSVIGLVYVVMIGVLYFGLQVAFVTHIRGNAVRLGPEQFPELYARVKGLADRMGMKRMPEAYLMQAGGTLNAFAARFLFSNMIVLFSDLLEACEDNISAQDMIIAHELGHLRAGHLRLRWLLLPFQIVPFLGKALSRAREYTCDRYGMAGAGNREGALLGLAVLAAGGRYGGRVNLRALASQRRELNTGWMTLGQWSSTHPTLARRITALDPDLGEGLPSSAGGTLRALAIILCILGLAGGGAFLAVRASASLFGLFPSMNPFSNLFPQTGPDEMSWEDYSGPDGSGGLLDEYGDYSSEYIVPDTAPEELDEAFGILSDFLAGELGAGRELPADYDELEARWWEMRDYSSLPIDPYDGDHIGYSRTDTGYILWSCGPDGETDTEDDILFEGP